MLGRILSDTNVKPASPFPFALNLQNLQFSPANGILRLRNRSFLNKRFITYISILLLDDLDENEMPHAKGCGNHPDWDVSFFRVRSYHGKR